MKKEVVIAIVLGFSLGLIITFGIWTANRVIEEKPAMAPSPITSLEPEETPTPTPQPTGLKIDQPQNDFISSQEEIVLAGLTFPEAVVIVFYEKGEKILEVDDRGNFETILELAEGANKIVVKSFNQSGQENEITLNVIYSTAEI